MGFISLDVIDKEWYDYWLDMDIQARLGNRQPVRKAIKTETWLPSDKIIQIKKGKNNCGSPVSELTIEGFDEPVFVLGYPPEIIEKIKQG